VRDRVSNRRRGVLLALRFLMLAILAFMLGFPFLRVEHPREGGAFTAFVLDTSCSMTIDDAGGPSQKVARIEAARSVLFGRPGGEEGVFEATGKLSIPALFAFDTEPRRADGKTVKAEGPFSNLFRAIRDTEAELRNVPLASVVLLTDGCRNQGGSAEEAARLLQARGVPLYTVGVGHEPPPRDYEVVQILAPRRVRRNSEVEMQVTVRHTDYREPFDLTLSRGNSTLLTQRIQPDPDSDTRQVRFTFTPDHEGTATYRVAIPQGSGETLTNNNSRDITIEMQDDRLPVLYVEGSPRFEYRFLRRAMFRDRDFRVVGLLRLSSNRVYVQGADASEGFLTNGFPAAKADLFRFQTVILGDIEASYFTPEQRRLLEEFVRERGGGLLMLGGVNSFGLGGYAGTPLEKLLPVRLSASDAPYRDGQFTVSLAAGAMDHPVMQVAANAAESKAIWGNIPPVIGITPLAGLKTGATLLLQDQKSALPILAVENYGAGRTAAFTSGGSWYWRMSRPASDEFDERVWKQLIRWLAVGAKDQLTVETDADTYARRDPVQIRASVFGTDLKPLNEARVMAVVTDPLGNNTEVSMDWILSEEGVYQCRYVPEMDGDYTIAVRAEGLDVKPVRKGFLVAQPTIEFSDAGLKRDLLKQMAQIANGDYFENP
ncbi:MAG: glutamine amidotransferase, partial [bacterium]